MKKAKGFTLIELIAAIAILSIAMVGISAAIMGGVNMTKKDIEKADKSIYAQNIIQYLKSKSETDLANKFPALGDTATGYYCYFDTEQQLNNILGNKADITTNAKNNFVTGTVDNLNSGVNTSGNNYGAYVEVVKNTELAPGKNIDSTYGINIIKISVKVFDLKNLSSGSSDMIFYIGG